MDKDTERLALEEIRQIENLLGGFRCEMGAGFDDISRILDRIERRLTRMEMVQHNFRLDGLERRVSRIERHLGISDSD